MHQLVYVVPTRGRPENVGRLCQAFIAHSRYPGTVLIFGLDEDDPKLEFIKATINEMAREATVPISFIVGPRLKMNGTLNSIAAKVVVQQNVGAVAFMGDDHLPRTTGWDVDYMNAISDGAWVVFGNDGIWGAQLPTQVCVDADLIRALGWMAPPELVHLYLDNFWRDIGAQLGFTYLPHVLVEHLHPIASKAEWDDTYVEANANHDDALRYNAFVAAGGIQRCVQEVQAYVR